MQVATYKLLIQKRYQGNPPWVKEIHFLLYFSVVDLDKGNFPLNYVCNLPRTSFTQTHFSKLFKDPFKIAVELLTAARKEYRDLDIQQEIDCRIAIIQQVEYL